MRTGWWYHRCGLDLTSVNPRCEDEQDEQVTWWMDGCLVEFEWRWRLITRVCWITSSPLRRLTVCSIERSEGQYLLDSILLVTRIGIHEHEVVEDLVNTQTWDGALPRRGHAGYLLRGVVNWLCVDERNNDKVHGNQVLELHNNTWSATCTWTVLVINSTPWMSHLFGVLGVDCLILSCLPLSKASCLV